MGMKYRGSVSFDGKESPHWIVYKEHVRGGWTLLMVCGTRAVGFFDPTAWVFGGRVVASEPRVWQLSRISRQP